MMLNKLETLANIFYVVGSDTIRFDQIETPENFLKWMDRIEYGWLDSYNKKMKGDDKFGEFWWDNYLFATPTLVVKYLIGTCYEQAILEHYVFDRKLYLENKVFFAADSNNKFDILDTNANTHMFLVYQQDGKWYWFEHSWDKEKGIHGPFDNINDIQEAYKKKTGSKNFFFKEIDPKKYTKRIDAKEFYKSVGFLDYINS